MCSSLSNFQVSKKCHLECPRFIDSQKQLCKGSHPISQKSAGPCLPAAPRLRRWDSFSFYQLAVIAFQLQPFSYLFFGGPKYPRINVPRSRSQNLVSHKKRVVFVFVFQKNQKNSSQGIHKLLNVDPEIL